MGHDPENREYMLLMVFSEESLADQIITFPFLNLLFISLAFY